MRVRLITVCLLALTGSLVVEGFTPRSSVKNNPMKMTENQTDPSNFSPYVDREGNILFPHGFKKDWQHLGSWSVSDVNGENTTLHNVYSPAYVAQEYRKSGQFPDGAPIIKEVLNTTSSSLTTGNAHWAGDVVVRFLMIKDQRNRFKDNPIWGDGWGWALFDKGNTSDQVAKDYKNDCLSCHIPAEDTDWVYVYGYPALGEVRNVSAKNISDTLVSTTMKDVDTSVENATLALGEKVFKRCVACHSLKPGKHKIGPSLAGVGNREAGFWSDYNYSDVMKELKVIWSEDNLNKHLKDVRGFVKGNKMGALFPVGIQDDTERNALVKYLMNVR